MCSRTNGYHNKAPCSQYLCPMTLDCVAKPIDCPCPETEDVKCVISDKVSGERDAGRVVCVRGQNECKEVEKLSRKR